MARAWTSTTGCGTTRAAIPAVLAYLEAENAWREAGLAHLAPLTERLYQEFVGRIRQDDASVPYRKRGHWYYSRFEAGDEYSVHARRVGAIDAPEQVLLDQRERALGHEFYDLGGFDISRDERLLAWTEDTVGRRQYTLRFRDLVTGLVLGDTITVSNRRWSGQPITTACSTSRRTPARCSDSVCGGTGSGHRRPRTSSCTRSTTRRSIPGSTRARTSDFS